MLIGIADPELAQPIVGGEQRLDIHGVPWVRYVAISEAIPEGKNPRIIYVDGRLTFVTTSRRHDFWSECLGDLVKAVAAGTGIGYAIGGRSTFRREDQEGGVEGDETFYLGENARIMRGSIDVDLATQPPPDLAIEVELSNPADQAMLAWDRIGVPEVWRFRVKTGTLTFWIRQPGGGYHQSGQSLGLPMLSLEDIASQLKFAEEMDAGSWVLGLYTWVRDVLVPRQVAGG